MNIYLIGMMGVGKSTIGNILSKKLEMPFIDLDHEIEKSAGSSIGKIFRSHGEEFFRNLESIALKNYFNSVISCGRYHPFKNKTDLLSKKMVNQFY